MSEDLTSDSFTDTNSSGESAEEEVTKPTSWGKIPSDWDEKTISEISQLVTDGSHNPPKRVEFGIQILSGQNIQNGYIDFSKEPSYISPSDFEQMDNNHSLRRGDLLMTIVGSIGRSAIVDEKTDFALQRSIGLLRANERVSSPFLKYITDSGRFHKQADSRSRATAQGGLYLEALNKINLPVPPLSEQRKIATVLHTVDQAIQKTKELIKQSKKVKRGLKQDLLSEGYNDHKIEQRRIGAKLRKIPSEWETVELGELAEYQNGYGFSKEQWSDTGRLIIRIQDLTTPEESDMNYFDGEIDPKYEVENGDILVSWSATLGVFRWNRGDAVLNQHIFKVRSIEDIVSEQFLYHILDDSLTELERKLHGSTMKHVTRSAFEGTEVPLPPKDEQIQIAKTLDDVDQQIQSYRNYLNKLQRIKKALIQDLLSGEVRTTDTDINIPEEVAKYG